MLYADVLAEREGFEPPVRLPVLRISSAARSTTLPPLQAIDHHRQIRISWWHETPDGHQNGRQIILFGASRYHKFKGRVEPSRGIALHCVGDVGIEVHGCGYGGVP